MKSAFRAALAALLTSALVACLEKPDPASQAAAILNKRPSSFQDRLVALDQLAAQELGPVARPILAESLYHYAARLGPILAAAPSDSARIDRLNAFLFDSLGLEPRPEDTALAASLPSRVLADRGGGCVGLALLYLALGEALDLPLVPIFLPGHLALRWRGPSTIRNIETLRRGLARPDSFYRETFVLARRPWYSLADGTPDQALATLVFNLANHHRSKGMVDAALEEYRLVVERLPGYPEALGNQGAALLLAGRREEALGSLEAALAGDSVATPARRNLEAHFGRRP